MVDQSTAAVVDDPTHRAFGHGTMVAGVIHLVAPRANLMSLKAFRSDGSGYTSDIIRAIYRAVQTNSRVINMSFSMPTYSRELERAINYAMGRGVVCVASAGNNGSATAVYPAAFAQMMGVASTDLNDKRSSFSNYGRSVWVAAPGEGIVTTYPFGTYAAGWGTSFSTPFVAGAAALLIDARPGSDQSAASTAISKAEPVSEELGHGRLDIYRAVEAIKFGR
jgi:thermitase